MCVLPCSPQALQEWEKAIRPLTGGDTRFGQGARRPALPLEAPPSILEPPLPGAHDGEWERKDGESRTRPQEPRYGDDGAEWDGRRKPSLRGDGGYDRGEDGGRPPLPRTSTSRRAPSGREGDRWEDDGRRRDSGRDFGTPVANEI